MKRFFLYLMLLVPTSNLWGQENYVLETRFRNPIDTAKFNESPTLLLFVHSKCQHEHLCPTMRMQKALEYDSLGLRFRLHISLYVIYNYYSEKDIKEFESFSPQRKAEVAFYTNAKYKGTFGDGAETPYMVFYDGKGNRWSKTGGTYEELRDSIYRWKLNYVRCPVCKGTGSATNPQERLRKGDADYWMCPNPKCRLSGYRGFMPIEK